MSLDSEFRELRDEVGFELDELEAVVRGPVEELLEGFKHSRNRGKG